MVTRRGTQYGRQPCDFDPLWVPHTTRRPTARTCYGESDVDPVSSRESSSEGEVTVEEVDVSGATASRNGDVRNPPTGISRPTGDRIVYDLVLVGVAASLGLLLMHLLVWAGVIAVGIAYPALQTLKALEKRNREYERRWAIYWVLAVSLMYIGYALRGVLGWIPGYGVALMSGLWWLGKNNAHNANYIYQVHGRPMFKKHERAVDNAAQQCVMLPDMLWKRALVKLNSLVAPYSRQLEAAAYRYRRQGRCRRGNCF